MAAYYDTLGISAASSQEKVADAYRERLKRFHHRRADIEDEEIGLAAVVLWRLCEKNTGYDAEKEAELEEAGSDGIASSVLARKRSMKEKEYSAWLDFLAARMIYENFTDSVINK
eukprot:IDg2585t1